MQKNINLCEIFTQVFCVPADEVTVNTSSQNLKAWDSLGQVALLTQIEKALGKRLTPREVSRIHSMQNLIQVLEQYGFKSQPQNPLIFESQTVSN